MKLKTKKLMCNAIIPKYMTEGSVGFDVSAIEDMEIPPRKLSKEIFAIHTGLAFEVPVGYEMNVRARSGLSLKYPNYIVMTGGGTIDSDYRGEVVVFVVNRTDCIWSIKRGDRIAQCIVAPVKQCEIEVVDKLSDTDRGSGGFGSTGK
jgi:dUTP pyrophosphatase